MTRAKSLTQYTDIRQQLEEMRAMGGAEIDLGSFGAAVSWIARVYTFRSLLRDQAKIGMPAGFDPSTPWDDLLIHHNKKLRSSTVEVEFGIKHRGNIKPLPEDRVRARQIVTELPTVVAGDDLLAAAMAEVAEKGDKK